MPDPEGWAKWLWAFWWLRGALTAGALVSLIPSFTGFSRYEFLRAVNAFIVQWNNIAGFVGSYIGRIPYIPDLSPAMVNSLVISILTYTPIITYYVIRLVRYEHQKKDHFTPFVLILAVGVMAFFLNYSIDKINNYKSTTEWFFALSTLLVSIVHVAMFIRTNCLYVPGYGKGLFSTLSLIFTLQVIYLLNIPFVVEGINNLSCWGAYIQESCSP